MGLNGNSQVSVKNSNSLGLSFYNENMKYLSVSGFQEGFYFWIPRNLNSTPRFQSLNMTNSTLSSENQIQPFTMNLTSANQSIHINLMPSNQQIGYVMCLKYGQMPVISSKNQIFDSIQIFCPFDLQSDDGGSTRFFAFFSSISANVRKDLKVGYGFRELTDAETSKFCINQTTKTLPNNKAPLLDNTFNFTSVIPSQVSIRVYTSGCYYIDNNTATWSSYGAEVLSDTTIFATHCVSSHLTEYAGGLVILPASIDFDSVWANASFDKNPTIYVTVILISCLYIFLLVWCRYMDWQDERKLGIYILKDNNPFDSYFYELIVFTGNRLESGTESNVYFNLAGSQGEVNNRILKSKKTKFKPLQRSSINSFIMATEK